MCEKCDCNCSSKISLEDTILIPILEEDTLEVPVYLNFRLWHVIFMGFASVMAVVICICCCVRFRIPRTKQEIEANYVRNKITRKFKKQLNLLQNTEMDEMDLKQALDRVRSEFKTDTEGLAHSEALDNESGNSAANGDAQIKPSATNTGNFKQEVMASQHSGFRSKISSFVGFLRPRRHNQHNSEEKPAKMAV